MGVHEEEEDGQNMGGGGNKRSEHTEEVYNQTILTWFLLSILCVCVCVWTVES